MNKEEMVEIFQKIIAEAFGQQKFDILRMSFDPNYVEHQFGLKTTIEGMQEDIKDMHKSFPDITFKIDEIVVEGDKLWSRMIARGTNKGGFMGPPNGKPYEIYVFDVVRFKDGKIVEHWGVPDRFAMMAQLGMLPHKP